MSDEDERLTDEIRFHIERQTEKNVRAGMAPAEARRAALLTFGGVERARESARDELRRGPAERLRGWWRDLRIGARTLRRAPAFTMTAVVTMGLGIGAASAMFSVYDGVLLRALPYPDSHRIVRVYQLGKSGDRGNASDPNFLDWRDGTRSLATMARMAGGGLTPVAAPGFADLARTTQVSSAFFDVMQLTPEAGRRFQGHELDPDGPPAAIVSAAFWARWRGNAQLGADQLRINGETFSVVGIMPAGFDYPSRTAIWTPRERRREAPSRTAHNFQVVARLADGVALESAQAEISTMSRGLKVRHGEGTWMYDAAVVPILEAATAASRPMLQMLFGASLLLLLVACTNVSNLLVARASARRRETAVQLALGATPGRLGRQVLAETLVICAAGMVAGIVVAIAIVRAFVAMAPATVTRIETVSVNWTALGFACLLSMLAAASLAVVTIAGSRTRHLTDALGDQTRSGTASRRQMRVRESLIATQIALTVVLLAGAGLLTRSLTSLLNVDPGYRVDEAVIADITLPAARDEDALVRRVAFQDQVLERLATTVPQAGLGLTSTFPLGNGFGSNGLFIEMSRPDEISSMAQFDFSSPAIKARSALADFRVASPGYFAAMGIPLVSGRLIDERDGPAASQVALISESLARSYWSGRDPIGRWLQYGNMDGDLRGLQIVGVVGDVRAGSLETPPAPTVYVAHRQRPGQASRFSIIVRGADVGVLSDAVRRAVRATDPEVPVAVRTMSATLDEAVGNRRFILWLVGAFGISALGLATLGVYGLVSYSVAQRAREMGIRLALGAQARSLVGLIVGRSAVLVAMGTAAGLALAWLLTGVVRGMLFGVTPTDPAVLTGVLLVTLLTASAASYLPARRVARIVPTESLRDS